MQKYSAHPNFKKKFFEALVLGYPNGRDPYTLTADVSLTGIGAILTQGTEDRVIAYDSRTLIKIERNCSATKLGLYAIVIFTHHFKNYILGQNFLQGTTGKSSESMIFKIQTVWSQDG